MKRLLSILIAAALLFALAACKNEPKPTPSTSQTTSAEDAPAAAASITGLLTLPDSGADLSELAAAYKRATGKTVELRAADAAGYAERLRLTLDSDKAPTLFALSGAADYSDLAEHCADLGKTSLYGFLSDKSLAITAGDGVYAIPYHVDGFGLLVNKDIADRYFALTDRKTTYASLDELNSFEKLKAFAEDLQAHKNALKIDAAFAPLDTDNETLWATRLSGLPLYYEFAENDDYDSPMMAALAADRVEFSFGDRLRDALQVFRNNSAKAADGGAASFAAGKTAMMLADTKTAAALEKAEGRTVQAENLRLLPLYIGADGEETQGVCVTDVQYLAVNADASAEERQAAVDFLEWLFSTDDGKRYAVETLGLTPPFNTFKEDEQPDNPITRQLLSWLAKDSVKSVPAMDNAFDDGLLSSMGKGLLSFLRGGQTWDAFVGTVKGWTRRAADAVTDAADEIGERISNAVDDARNTLDSTGATGR